LTQTADSAESPIHILKTATCKTLAGTAILSYLIGIDQKEVLYWKFAENFGWSMSSQEWLSHVEILPATSSNHIS
jgi:hypothetical protein